VTNFQEFIQDIHWNKKDILYQKLFLKDLVILEESSILEEISFIEEISIHQELIFLMR
jgi:hypothetical protein